MKADYSRKLIGGAKELTAALGTKETLLHKEVETSHEQPNIPDVNRPHAAATCALSRVGRSRLGPPALPGPAHPLREPCTEAAYVGKGSGRLRVRTNNTPPRTWENITPLS